MRKVVSAGGLIFDGRRMLISRYPDGKYGLVKGHVEPGETLEQAAIREVREEAGLEAEIIRYVGRVNRPATENNGEIVDKDIELFLMRVTGKATNLPEEDIDWIDVDAVLKGPWRPQELAFLKEHVLSLVNVAASEDAVADN